MTFRSIKPRLREATLLASQVVGYETAIVQILDKYNIPVSDQNRIIDYLASIERTTVRVVLEKQKEERYLKRMELINNAEAEDKN